MKINKYTKKVSGITLIALVITIIVLLILAGVSISLLSGDNGILTRAQQAKEAMRGGEVKDIVALAAMNNAGAEYVEGTKQTKAEIINELYSSGKLTDTEMAELVSNDTIVIDGVSIDFSIIEPTSSGKTLVQSFKDGEIEIGDYVQYSPSNTNKSKVVTLTQEKTGVEGTQVYNFENSISWQILGVQGTGENEHLVLISNTPLRKNTETSTGGITDGSVDPYLHLASGEAFAWTNDEYVQAGYINENILDSICRIYNNEAIADDVRSIRVEDLNNALGLEASEAGLFKKTDTSHSNDLMRYNDIGSINYYEEDDYAPENYLKAIYLNRFGGLDTKKIGDSVLGNDYSYSYSSSDIIDQSSKLYELLFGDTVLDLVNWWNCSGPKSYWLATNTGSYYGGFGPGHVSNGVIETNVGIIGWLRRLA